MFVSVHHRSILLDHSDFDVKGSDKIHTRLNVPHMDPMLCGTEIRSQGPQDLSLIIVRQLSFSKSAVGATLVKLEHLWCRIQ